MTRVAVSTLLLAFALLIPTTAIGDDDVTPSQSGFVVAGAGGAQGYVGDGGSTSETADLSGSVQEETQCAIGGLETCSELALCDNGTVMVYTWFETPDGDRLNYHSNCPEDVMAEAPPEVTPGLVLAALRRIDLLGSELVVQPPGGRTLVNFETNFYTVNGEFSRTVRLLGQRVELRIWPSAYGWRFGDGAVRQTSGAGSPYPDLEITHRYLSRGRVAPRVDTTYAAQFRVNGGPWRDVAGTVLVPGAAEGLRVVEARPVLVGY